MKYLEINEVQKLLLEMLLEFDLVCREHNIRYSLDAGTLLGAVRHKGFIPWDDDVDVIVPRPDYETLIRHNEWFANDINIQSNVNNSTHILPFAKMVNLNWRAQEPAFIGVIDEYLWIDIFPVDAVPDNDEEALRIIKKQKRLHDFGVRSMVNEDAVTPNQIKRLAKKVLLPIHRKVYPHYRQFEKLESNAKSLEFGTTKRVCNITWSLYRPSWIRTDDFDNLIDIEFEGKEFKVIPHWDELLTKHYGDYMTLPPEADRSGHGVRVWKV